MKFKTFSIRTAKEITRDPVNMFFGLAFPAILIILLTQIQKNIPAPMFQLNDLIPGMTIFGLSFLTLFSSVLLSKDKESAFLERLYTTPLTATDFIFGYTVPLLPMAFMQCLACYVIGMILGLKFTVNILYALLSIIPISILFISIGLICGSIFTSKQVGGICGALLTNLTAWLSGIWFDVKLVGGRFEKIANALPYLHAVELERAIYNGNFSEISAHTFPVLIYVIISTLLATFVFLKQMNRDR